MRITHYDRFLNEDESPKILQGFILDHKNYLHIGAEYTLPDFLDRVYEDLTGDAAEGRFLLPGDLENALGDYDDNGEPPEIALWCVNLRHPGSPQYSTLSLNNPYSAVETLDSWFLNAKKEMTLRYTGNLERDMTWLARSIENDPELIGEYSEKHPELLKGAIDLLKSGDQDKIHALLKYHKIKGLI